MTPEPEQINRTIHEALGKCWHEFIPTEVDALNAENRPYKALVPLCKCGANKNITGLDHPEYTDDLNLCALAEAEVERRGLGGEYYLRIRKISTTPFSVLTASAEVRAPALAATLGGEK